MALSGAAAEFIAKTFGGSFEETDSEVSVGLSKTKIIGNDPDAVSLVIINLGVNDVYIAPDNKPSSSRGIFVGAGGGAVSMNARDDLTLPTREWWGIADGGASDVYYIRVRRFNVGSPVGG